MDPTHPAALLGQGPGPRWLLTQAEGQAVGRAQPGLTRARPLKAGLRNRSGRLWLKGLGGGLHGSRQAAQAQPRSLHTSWGVCVMLICPASFCWKVLPVCFYPGLVLPARVQTLENLRQNTRDTEPWLQVPDGTWSALL